MLDNGSLEIHSSLSFLIMEMDEAIPYEDHEDVDYELEDNMVNDRYDTVFAEDIKPIGKISVKEEYDDEVEEVEMKAIKIVLDHVKEPMLVTYEYRKVLSSPQDCEINENIKNDRLTMELLYKDMYPAKSNYYTKCILFLFQKYGTLTANQIATTIGNVKAKQLYDYLNVMCDVGLLKKKNTEHFVFMRNIRLIEPLNDLVKVKSRLELVKEEISGLEELIKNYGK